MQIEDLFFAPEDLYRIGNSSDPRLAHVRQPKDVDVTEMNGIAIVVANGKGVSLFTKDRLKHTSTSAWVWKLGRGTTLPPGLRLLNDRPSHYSLCPTQNMPLDEFKGLLSRLALKCERVQRTQVANG